jgi:mRNA interferase RelE/StbE
VTHAPWRVRVMPPARRQLDTLPLSVATAIVETFAAIADNPRRLGKPLRFELEGRWSARRGPYRIIYSIDDHNRTVTILAVGHRPYIYRRP